MRTFLGVDGGGTKTDFLLIDEAGSVLSTHRAGSAYYLEIGVDALRTMLVEGIHRTLAQARLRPGDLTFACLGLPSYGEDSALTPRLDTLVVEILAASSHRCVNDMVCGWSAALACRDGINVVAGTGSIGYGEFAGQSARAGGWGELFGDEGSAFWIAREALTLFSRMSDGRAEKTPLYALMRQHFALNDDLDLCAAIYGPPALARSDIAALAPLLSRAAAAGDVQALQLLERAAQELAAIVNAVRDRLTVPPAVSLPVSCSGGLFRRDNPLAGLLEAALHQGSHRYEFSAPRFTPGAGAALYAARLAGVTLTPIALEQLERTQGAAREGEVA